MGPITMDRIGFNTSHHKNQLLMLVKTKKLLSILEIAIQPNGARTIKMIVCSVSIFNLASQS